MGGVRRVEEETTARMADQPWRSGLATQPPDVKGAIDDAGFWRSTYGVDEHTVTELQRSMSVAVAKLVEPSVAATL